MRAYVNDPELRKAEIIAQVALAKTLKKALKNGDIKTVTNGKTKSYMVLASKTILNPFTASRWYKLGKIGEPKIQRYFAKQDEDSKSASISAAGCISWLAMEKRREEAASIAEDLESDEIVAR